MRLVLCLCRLGHVRTYAAMVDGMPEADMKSDLEAKLNANRTFRGCKVCGSTERNFEVSQETYTSVGEILAVIARRMKADLDKNTRDKGGPNN